MSGSMSGSSGSNAKKVSLSDRFLIGEELGRGAYGQVYKGLDQKSGENVAIKQIPLTGVSNENLQNVMGEIDLLKTLNHRNIVKYLGFFKTRTHLYIILEFMENGSLSSIIKPSKFGVFPESLVAVYISQVLTGLQYLHDQGVVHRDIKGANILTTKEGLVKLADFGVAAKLGELEEAAGQHTQNVVGSPYWMAPEVIEMKQVTPAADIWSVGCLIVELLTGYPPYFDLQAMSALFRIVQDDHPPLPDNISPIMQDFLLLCFKKDPKDRPSATVLLRHDWVQVNRRTLSKSWGKTMGPRTRATRLSDAHESVHTVVSRILALDSDPPSTPTPPHPPTAAPPSSATASSTTSSIPATPTAPRYPSDALPPVHPSPSRHPPPLIITDDPTGPPAQPPYPPQTHLPRSRSATAVPAFPHSSDPHSSDPPSDSYPLLPPPRDGTATASTSSSGLPNRRATDPTPSGPPRGNTLSWGTASGASTALWGKPEEALQAASTALEDTVARLLQGAEAAAGGGPGAGGGPNLTAWLEEAGDRRGYGDGVKALYGELYRPEQVSSSGDSWLRGQARPSSVDLMVEGSAVSVEGRRKVQNLVRSMRPGTRDSNMSVVEACSSLAVLLSRQADARLQFVQEGGLLALLELMDSDNPKFLDKALEVALALSADTAVLENMCLLGIVPAACRLAQQSWPTGLRARAAHFMQQLCFASPATLQLLVSCQGLKHLVALVNDNLLETGALTSTALSCAWRVLEAGHSAALPMPQLCRCLAQYGLGGRLVALIKQLLAPSKPHPPHAASSSSLATSSIHTTGDPSASDRSSRLLPRTAIAPSPRNDSHRSHAGGNPHDSLSALTPSSSIARAPSSASAAVPAAPVWDPQAGGGEWLLEVAVNLLLLLANGDAVVKLNVCTRETLQNLLDCLQRLQQPHITKVLQSIRLFAGEPAVAPVMKDAGTIQALVPFLSREREREAPRPQMEALAALHVLCKYNKRVHLEFAASAGATPHLCRLAKELADKPPQQQQQQQQGAPPAAAGLPPRGANSSTKGQAASGTAEQQAEAEARLAAIRALVVPMLIGMVSASATTRAKLLAAGGLDVFLVLLDSQDVQLQQGLLRALDMWLEEDMPRVEPRLTKPDALAHLVSLFAAAARTASTTPALPQQLEVLKSMLSRSPKLAVALVNGGLVPWLIKMLNVPAPLLRARVLDIIRTLYEHYPRPKEFIMRYPIQEELKKLLASDMRGDDAVKRECEKLLSAFNINIIL